MKTLFRNIIKDTLTFAAVGVLLAVALPYVAVALHLAATTAAASALFGINSPALLGVYFGGFGGVAAALAPVSNFLFGKKAEENPVLSQTQDKVPFPDFSTIERAPAKTLYVDTVNANRLNVDTIVRH